MALRAELEALVAEAKALETKWKAFIDTRLAGHTIPVDDLLAGVHEQVEKLAGWASGHIKQLEIQAVTEGRPMP